MSFDLLNDGIYFGNLNNFLDKPELENVKNNVSSLRNYYNDSNTQIFCKYMYHVDAAETYTHDIPLSEKAIREKYIENGNYKPSQRWNFFHHQDLQNYFNEIASKIYYNFYKNPIDLNTTNSVFTLYESGDFIEIHKDGNNENRMCGIIIYLNNEDEYKNQGGEFKFLTDNGKTDLIPPLLNNFVILDFTKNNVKHAVTKVKGDFKRLSYITFINTKTT
jgi:Rps23 Pro-64 3,4-dihydroxylase Tpa1-like proline 4-hydroxylase